MEVRGSILEVEQGLEVSFDDEEVGIGKDGRVEERKEAKGKVDGGGRVGWGILTGRPAGRLSLSASQSNPVTDGTTDISPTWVSILYIGLDLYSSSMNEFARRPKTGTS